ncbi:MAG: formate--tetrahydrofolate ligase [Eggerthellaceae bacterium]|nr:formate--tetrahydrofolate ligase [Eggerthellaceae bacterium]
MNFSNMLACTTKTQCSFNVDPAKQEVSQIFLMSVRRLKVKAGAPFVVVQT